MRTLTLLCISSALLFSTEVAPVFCKDPSNHIVETPAQKATYENCTRNGMTWWYNTRGAVKSKVNFVNDQEHGIYTSYHDNGEKKLVVNFTHGQKR